MLRPLLLILVTSIANACTDPLTPTGPVEPLEHTTADGFELIDLGTLGGRSSAANAIDDAGRIVGSSWVRGDTAVHAFLWEEGEMLDLGTLGGHTSHALGMNEAGQVVGVSDTEAAGMTRPFLWEDGVMTELGTLGGDNATARAVNASGQIVGSSQNSEGAWRATLWKQGRACDLGCLSGGSSSGASDINDAGRIVGSGTLGPTLFLFHAVLWEGGEIIDLGTLGDPSWSSEARAINRHGDVVGTSCTTDDAEICDLHAVLWRDRTIVDLGADWVPTDINDSGVIVGMRRPTGDIVIDPVTGDPIEPGFTEAVFWRDGTLTRLPDFGAPSGARAHAINDHGWIVGLAQPADETQPRAVLWRPR